MHSIIIVSLLTISKAMKKGPILFLENVKPKTAFCNLTGSFPVQISMQYCAHYAIPSLQCSIQQGFNLHIRGFFY